MATHTTNFAGTGAIGAARGIFTTGTGTVTLTPTAGAMISGNSIGTGVLLVGTDSSFASGRASSTCQLQADKKGCFAQGYTASSSAIRAGYTVGYGAVAQGFAKNSAKIYSIERGTFAQGFSYDNSSINASGKGAFTQGYAIDYGFVLASANGSMAQGWTNGNQVTETSIAVNAKAYIWASGKGSFAQGYVSCSLTRDDDCYLRASGTGSFAHGYINFGSNGYAKVLASGKGSAIFCSISTGDNYTTANTTNAINNSLQVGGSAPVRIIGSGVPGAYRNGDIWLNGNDVIIATGGGTKNVSTLT